VNEEKLSGELLYMASTVPCQVATTLEVLCSTDNVQNKNFHFCQHFIEKRKISAVCLGQKK